MNLVVFDIDDTLTKSERQHQSSFVKAMKDFGIIEIDTNWKSYQHHTDSFILKENFERNLNTSFNFSFMDEFESCMYDHISKLHPVSEIADAKRILTAFSKNSNYVVAFATGSLLKPALLKLHQIELDFDETLVIGSNSIFDREGIVSQAIENAKQFYGINSFEHIISVGDGIWDLKTARNLGLHFMRIGLKNDDDFQKENIKYHIKDWTEFQLSKFEQVFMNS